uniref:SRA stem-loop-interacting RNA-binding protein, mitochondrial n=1 Tax=Odobenus rosmarus divergens TaxID=9708 RepID=UPI00063C4D12|nr:PREDICTED: SRA stem-loop-interacting RNA-binding protein, mitochondrial [Odobenus rosmarus divergens]
MAASAVRGAVALRTSISRPVAFVRKIPWTAASQSTAFRDGLNGVRVRKEGKGRRTSRFLALVNIVDKETGFHRGMGWIQFSSEEELQNALQQENHILDGVKLHVQAQRPKVLQGDQTSDEEKDF